MDRKEQNWWIGDFGYLLTGRKFESFGSLPRHEDEVSAFGFEIERKKEKLENKILFIERHVIEYSISPGTKLQKQKLSTHKTNFSRVSRWGFVKLKEDELLQSVTQRNTIIIINIIEIEI